MEACLQIIVSKYTRSMFSLRTGFVFATMNSMRNPIVRVTTLLFVVAAIGVALGSPQAPARRSNAQEWHTQLTVAALSRQGPIGTFAYTIQPGDTLFSIAQRYDTTVETIAAINQIADPGQISVGWTIYIPNQPVHSGPSVQVAHGDRASGEVALTFDMGGRVEPALDIMNWLIDNEIRATIFMTGAIVDSVNTDAGRQVLALIEDHPELFDLGNHSYSHPDFRDLTGAEMIEEIADADDSIAAHIDVDLKPFFRPPFGGVDQSVLDGVGEAGYAYTVMWDIDTIDWLPEADGGPTTTAMVNKVTTQAQGGSIVLMHLGGYNTLAALPGMVAGLEAKGLEFTTLSDMFGQLRPTSYREGRAMHTLLLRQSASPAYIQQISTSGLGDHSYLVVVGNEVAVIDPQRDIERFQDQLLASGARLVAVLETHVHNDYVTGGAALARAAGAEYLVPLESGLTIPHRRMGEGDGVAVGGWSLTAMHTPGHTPQHVSYRLSSSGGEDVAVFTGGSMLVGAVGRTDLLSDDLTESLTRLQYGSVRRIGGELPSPAWVAPTHGAGSFCAASDVADTVSTIELEHGRNPGLLARDEESFVREQLDGLRLYPAYYRHMAALNRGGPTTPVLAPVPYLNPDEVGALGAETWIVDLRPAREFAGAHIPGSINIPAGDDAATYIGWVIPWGAPFVLITEGAHQLAHHRLALARIGIENITGAIVDGLAAWRGHNRPVESYRVAKFVDLYREHPAQILDVRDPVEHEASALPGAQSLHISRILENGAEVPTGELWVHCAGGYRAAIGASLVARLGRQPVAVLDSYPPSHA